MKKSNFRTPSFPEICQSEREEDGFHQRRRQAALLLLQVGLTSGFIDHPETTRAKILSKFDRAIALAAEN